MKILNFPKLKPLEAALEWDKINYESVLEHQNSLYCSNPYTDGFGIFGKNLSQFKTVLEEQSTDNSDDDVPLDMPIDFYCVVVLKEESIVKQPCLCVEVISDENLDPKEGTSQVPAVQTPLTPSTPQHIPVATSTPKTMTPFRSSAHKNLIALNYFKSRKKELEEGASASKRKRLEEIQNLPSENPAKRVLLVN